jgi:hypothetical protein
VGDARDLEILVCRERTLDGLEQQPVVVGDDDP